MSVRDRIATDLVISPLGADAAAMLDVARCAENSGYDGICTLDHFSGTMLDRPWSRELFTVLGGFAAVTSSVRIGALVANTVNRHASLLASAAATLQSMSGGRAVLGIGSGPGPGSRFAGEQDAIARPLADGEGRRRSLVEHIEVVRLLWQGGGHYDGEFVTLRGLDGVVGPEPEIPVIVGASGPLTVEVACARADGVNIVVGARADELVGMARGLTGHRPFEIGIYDTIDLDHAHGGDVDRWAALGVDRRTLAVRPPFDLEAIARVGAALNAA